MSKPVSQRFLFINFETEMDLVDFIENLKWQPSEELPYNTFAIPEESFVIITSEKYSSKAIMKYMSGEGYGIVIDIVTYDVVAWNVKTLKSDDISELEKRVEEMYGEPEE